MLAHNPDGVLAFRDELISLLKHLDDARNASARGFYLTAWNGTIHILPSTASFGVPRHIRRRPLVFRPLGRRSPAGWPNTCVAPEALATTA